MNNVILIGRIARDIELKYIPNTGTAVCKFSIAVDRGLSKEKKQEAEANNQPTADFINIIAWGKTAENCATYLAKGRLVGVQGRIQTGSYVADDGSRRYTTEVVASNVEFLEWPKKDDQAPDFGGFADFNTDGFYPTDNDDIPF